MMTHTIIAAGPVVLLAIMLIGIGSSLDDRTFGFVGTFVFCTEAGVGERQANAERGQACEPY
jgi:hypothetical protein